MTETDVGYVLSLIDELQEEIDRLKGGLKNERGLYFNGN